ncbi:cold shock domain-containing protein C2-like [Hydractinia symbiolongicarpus]|uniref:cold shock domain-containing protein C2-like n=1 Tax=Hydractinia symbiolongicarpus TaxID=13093 RepID=UPI00254FCBAF|nr:cold shock domain-containing protein C2-like [Hydractinia symbiolongicarpus]
MSASKPIPAKESSRNKGEFVAPSSPPKHASPRHHHHLNIPSPIPCRRTRTSSISRLAADSDVQEGIVIQFCREKGHGFVKPDDEEKPIFLHISDIEDEYVVHKGDRVEFRTIPMPPKCLEKMAVEVKLISFNPEVPHERWDSKPDL